MEFPQFLPSRFPSCLLYARTCRIHDKLISHKNKSIVVTNHTRDLETWGTTDTEWFYWSRSQFFLKTVSKHSLSYQRRTWIIAIPLYGEPKPVREYSTKFSTCNINFYHLSLKMAKSQQTMLGNREYLTRWQKNHLQWRGTGGRENWGRERAGSRNYLRA